MVVYIILFGQADTQLHLREELIWGIGWKMCSMVFGAVYTAANGLMKPVLNSMPMLGMIFISNFAHYGQILCPNLSNFTFHDFIFNFPNELMSVTFRLHWLIDKYVNLDS